MLIQLYRIDCYYHALVLVAAFYIRWLVSQYTHSWSFFAAITYVLVAYLYLGA